MKLFGKFFLILFILTSCAGPHIGKTFDYARILSTVGTRHHNFVFEPFTIDYEYDINEERDEISFDGVIESRQGADHAGGTFSVINLSVIFLDSFKEAIAVEQFTALPIRADDEPIPFKGACQFKPEYHYVTFHARWKEAK